MSLTIKGNIVDIKNKSINKGQIIIENDRISKIEFIDVVEEQYILPGFIDAHVHIESSMLVPSEFARSAVRFGTVAVVTDPHEIANVLGIQGVEYMIQNAQRVPFKVFFGAPSCVPATNFETSGAKITAEDIQYLFEKYNLKFLSEMMNFPGVIYEDPEVIKKIDIARLLNKKIDGHAPGLIGDGLKKYASLGISTDHECFSYEEAKEKIKFGIKILIREGSAAKNFKNLSKLLAENPDMCMFCTDDIHPDDFQKGHINLIVKKAIEKGFNLFDVLQVACINPIDHYGLEVGQLREGDFADFIVVDNLRDFNVKQTYINGKLVAENGTSLIEKQEINKINTFKAKKLNESDIKIEPKGNFIQVIRAIDGELITEKLLVKPKTVDNYVESDIDNDILKLVVYNRYTESKPAIGFINNFNLRSGAIATSVVHDSHNIIALGTNDKDIIQAINSIIDYKGGMCVVNDDLEILPLPIAGIISDKSIEETSEIYQKLNTKAKKLGTKLTAPFMTLSFMALLVIPKLKLSDKGLFDVDNFTYTNLFV